MILKTIQMEREEVNGWVERHWDFCDNPQGFAIQRNGKTVNGRLSGYGARELWAEFIHKDIQRGWKVVDETLDLDNRFHDVGRQFG